MSTAANEPQPGEDWDDTANHTSPGADRIRVAIGRIARDLAAKADNGASLEMAVGEAQRDLAQALRRRATAATKPADQAPVAPQGEGASFAPTVEAILLSDALSKPRRVYPTGFRELDRLLSGSYRSDAPDGGLAARTLTVFAGPTGAGKTGWAVALAVHFARRLRDVAPVLYVSTELEAVEVAARVAAQALEAHERATIREGDFGRYFTPGEILSLRIKPGEAAAAVAGWPIHVLEWDPWSPEQKLPAIESIAAEAHSINKVTGKMPVIVVDYLQHLASEDPDQRRLSVSAVANGLRRLARDLDVPVVALSSVGRQNYKIKKADEDGDGEDARDYIAAAKESGDIEYACAVFGYLEPGRTTDADGESPARLAVAKCRGGLHGFVGLRFHGPSGLWWDDSAALEAMGVAARMAELDEKVLAALAKLPAPMKREAFVESVGGRKGEVRASLDRLVLKGQVVESEGPMSAGGGRRPRMVSLTDAPGHQGDLC
jgi:replicative DNA helicase